MNEADTRAELIEPQFRASGWGENGSRSSPRSGGLNVAVVFQPTV